eukprot:2607275-Rhodomonas_salina.2
MALCAGESQCGMRPTQAWELEAGDSEMIQGFRVVYFSSRSQISPRGTDTEAVLSLGLDDLLNWHF